MQPPATHWPPEHEEPGPQVMLAHGSAHWPDRQTRPGAHGALGHGTPSHVLVVALHVNPLGQRSVSALHVVGRQRPPVQEKPLPHRLPSSTPFLQSSSLPLHTSGFGSTWPAH